MTNQAPHVVVLGAGFGGLTFCRTFNHPGARVTLVDRTNHHLFSPLLYQVATAGLSAPAIAAPIRHILAGYNNTTVLLGEATAIDVANKSVRLDDGSALPYDTLIVATGAANSYFGHDEWAQHAP